MITYPIMDGRISYANRFDWPGELEEIPAAIWARLHRALGHEGDPWRTPIVATTANRNTPNARTVVLRDVDAPRATLAFHTHRLAPKTGECRAGARIMWVFYDPLAGVQLRACGLAEPVDSGPRRLSAWEGLPSRQRTLYQVDIPPGKRLPPGRERTAPVITMPQAEEAFTLVETRIESMHFLFLEPPMNRAARFTREGGRWQGCWVAA